MSELAQRLGDYIAERRWFRSKTRARRAVEIVDTIPVDDARLTFVRISFAEGDDEIYVVPLMPGDAVQDGLQTGAFGDVLLGAIAGERAFEGARSALRTRRFAVDLDDPPRARASTAEQTNTTLFFGERLIMKVYRSVVAGENPEVEILRHLAAHPEVSTPRLAGEALWEHEGQTAAVAIVSTFVKSRGDAWGATLERLSSLLAGRSSLDEERARARLLGARTAAMHRALAAKASDPAFGASPVTDEVRDAVVRSTRARTQRIFRTLRQRGELVRPDTRPLVERLLAREAAVLSLLDRAATLNVTTKRTRVHGDYHLGQVLVTPDDDFVIIDFEGEPARTLEERREKAIPLRDVAGMLRSFDYAAVTALRAASDPAKAKSTIDAWRAGVSESFLDGWRQGVAGSDAAPASPEEERVLLDLFVIDKAVYEVGYELDNRPDWLSIPVEGLLALVG